MVLKIKIKVVKRDPKRACFCDKCGESSMNTRMYRKKNFPYGKKSKPVYRNKCARCKKPGLKEIKIILR